MGYFQDEAKDGDNHHKCGAPWRSILLILLWIPCSTPIDKPDKVDNPCEGDEVVEPCFLGLQWLIIYIGVLIIPEEDGESEDG